MGSHSVTEMKINWGKIWNPPGFSWCGTHKALLRSDFAFSRSFLRESYSGLLTRQTCSLSLLQPRGDLWGCKLDRKDHQPTSESFPLSCQRAGRPLKGGLTPPIMWSLSLCRLRAQLFPLSVEETLPLRVISSLLRRYGECWWLCNHSIKQTNKQTTNKNVLSFDIYCCVYVNG